MTDFEGSSNRFSWRLMAERRRKAMSTGALKPMNTSVGRIEEDGVLSSPYVRGWIRLPATDRTTRKSRERVELQRTGLVTPASCSGTCLLFLR